MKIFLIHTDVLPTIAISLFRYCQKVFILMILETSLLEKEDFYSYLNMENITDADYAHAKRVCKDYEIKNLGEYHDLYVQPDTLLLVDVFESLRNISLKIYELDPAKFFSVFPWTIFCNNLKNHISYTLEILIQCTKFSCKYFSENVLKICPLRMRKLIIHKDGHTK